MPSVLLISQLKFNPEGLVPVVVQDARDGTVLTLAYANQEALLRTLNSRYSTFFSRSRQEIWVKGLTSGHLQEVIEVRVDCDLDAVLYRVIPRGPGCHTGAPSCFFTPLDASEPWGHP